MKLIRSFVKGDKVTCNLVLDRATVRQTKTNKDYLDITFKDGYDEINGKIWDWTGRVPEIAKVYTLEATVGEFNNRKQITVEQIALAENQNLSQFTPVVEVPIDVLRSHLADAIESINHPSLKAIVSAIYAEYDEQLVTSTSAKGNHHVGVGGNLMHTLEVFETAVSIALVNPQWAIDLDLVKAGALLHDIGKAFTYTMEGPVIDYTDDGSLLDHTVIGMLMLNRFRPDHGDRVVSLLQHMVASHHGELEYGSPVMPRCMEAVLVSMADNLSAKLDCIDTYNQKAYDTGQTTTEKIYVCGNVSFFTQKAVADNLYGTEE